MYAGAVRASKSRNHVRYTAQQFTVDGAVNHCVNRTGSLAGLSLVVLGNQYVCNVLVVADRESELYAAQLCVTIR